MKFIKKILRAIISVAIVINLSLPMFTTTVRAAEASDFTIDETFAPTRNYIPQYLSMYSGFRSDLMKKLWEKVIYEEANWNGEKLPDGTPKYPWFTKKYSTWTKKYGHSATYTGLGGTSKKAEDLSSISYDSTDFDAFFAVALKTNPEFLGELLGLSGYDAVSTVAYGNPNLSSPLDATRKMVTAHFKNPANYTHFTDAVIELTSDGTYLNNPSLKEISIDGIRLDYLFLTTLAAKYRVKNFEGEFVLSNTQIHWIEDNYQKPLYDAYTLNNNQALKNLVQSYPSLYDLIARSKYAANNVNGYGQIFFNYVVDSKIGGGTFLNLNDSINIAGLNDIDDIAGLFTVSAGWCKGVESSHVCYNHTNCVNNGTAGDYIATMLSKNSTAKNYILANNVTKTAFGVDNYSGWRNRYRIKHTKYSGTPTDTLRFNNISYNYSTDGRRTCESTSPGYGMGGPRTSCSSTTTIAVPLGRLPESVRGTLQRITVYSASRGTNWNYGAGGYGLHMDVAFRGFSSNNPKVRFLDMALPTHTNSNGSTYTWPDTVQLSNPERDIAYVIPTVFDVSDLNDEEMKNCVIYVTVMAIDGAYHESGDGGTDRGTALSTTLGYVDCECTIDDCDINGHKYEGEAFFSEDYSSATIKYNCETNRLHTAEETVTDITEVIDGNLKTYVAKGSMGSSFSSGKINIATGEAYTDKTIVINNDTATGTFASTGTNNERVYPEGSVSNYTFKKAVTNVDASIKSGIIGPGVKSVSVDVSASADLEDLQIIIYAADSTPIGRSSFKNSGERFTAYLKYKDNEHLDGAYMKITGRSSTRNEERFTPLVGGPEPATAVTRLKLNSLTLHY